MSKDRIYFLLNEANEIVEGFINATDAWRAIQNQHQCICADRI